METTVTNQPGHKGAFAESMQGGAIFYTPDITSPHHRVCMTDIGKDGSLSLDEDFKDKVTGQPCISFNRKDWPHGAFGFAKPHSMLFVAADDDTK